MGPINITWEVTKVNHLCKSQTTWPSQYHLSLFHAGHESSQRTHAELIVQPVLYVCRFHNQELRLPQLNTVWKNSCIRLNIYRIIFSLNNTAKKEFMYYLHNTRKNKTNRDGLNTQKKVHRLCANTILFSTRGLSIFRSWVLYLYARTLSCRHQRVTI